MTLDKHLPRRILVSKRANLYYLEHCRVMVRGGCVEFATPEGGQESYWNIPIANTTFLLLGNGTSVTQAAMRMLAEAGVAVGFSGGGGTPLFSGVGITWVTPQSTCATTEYLQKWLSLWMDDTRRLSAAKRLQKDRLAFTKKWWSSSHFKDQGFRPTSLANAAEEFEDNIINSTSIEQLLGGELAWTKKLYSLAAQATRHTSFQRDTAGSDKTNQFLNHGNELAEGCGTVTAWTLGLPPQLAVLHRGTHQNGLVLDLADVVKDGIILPQAFLSAREGSTEKSFRAACTDLLTAQGGLQAMFDTATGVTECV